MSHNDSVSLIKQLRCSLRSPLIEVPVGFPNLNFLVSPPPLMQKGVSISNMKIKQTDGQSHSKLIGVPESNSKNFSKITV